MIDAVIFDMDGVLIDSIDAAFEAKTRVLARRGIDLSTVPDPQHEQHRGASMKTLLKAIKDHHGIEIDVEHFKDEVIHEVHASLVARGVAVDPGLTRFLDDLRDHGVVCAITTSGVRQSVDNKLDILGIENYFSLIVTAEDVSAHKPDPEPYLYTMQRLRALPRNCVIFEDSLTGVQAGLAAGAQVIGFTQFNSDTHAFEGTLSTIHGWSQVSYERLSCLLEKAVA